MRFKTMKEALASITKRSREVGGKEYITFDAYLGVDPITKKVRRMFDRDEPRLRQRVKEFYSSINRHGDIGALLTPMQIMDAKAAYDALAAAGVQMTIRDVVKEYLDGKRAKAAVNAKAIGEAYDEYLASFGSLQVSHVDAVKYRVGHWVSAEGRGKRLSDVTAQSVVSFIDSRFSSSNKSWNNAMTYISSFLNWCMSPERAYIAENPIRIVKKKQIAWQEPKYLTPAQAEATLRLCDSWRLKRPDMLSYAILNMLCGMRREEILRMAKDPEAVRVNLQDETIRVAKPKGFQKGIRPRAFHIPENALAWMKSFDFDIGVRGITDKTSMYITREMRLAGEKIPNNAGRHTFITMHCAAYGDPSRTEAIVGTSATMRAQNYMGLASKKDGEAFFSIMPK